MRRAVCAFVAAVFASGVASAQVSLWAPSRADKTECNLLAEVTARSFKVHDIVSVVVSLSAEASTDEQADMEKKTDQLKFAIEQYLRLRKDDDHLLGLNVEGHKPTDLGVDMSSDKKFQGEGTTDRKDTLRTRLAAEITDIKPNGNLVIEARHTFTKQREKTTITITGVVRPQDVSPDNAVYSYNVADADIRYESSGPVTDASRRGWLAKFLDRVWPF